MSNLERLFNLAGKENIDIHYFNLKEIGCLGLSVEKQDMNIIFLDHTLKEDKYKLIEVLSEELGHYFTSYENSISNINTYRDKLKVSRCENKATRWATHFLVNEDEIIRLINGNITSLHEIAEILGVDSKIILKKLEYISKTKSMLDLRNGKYLVLTNLPNIYIYEPLL